jgi:hypothetical protein
MARRSDRTSPARLRARMVVGGTATVLLAGAITSLTLEACPGGTRRPIPVELRPSRPAPAPAASPPVNSPVSVAELHAARLVAARFLVSYLRLAYGRAGAAAVRAITPELRGQLNRGGARVTPVERRRHPRAVSWSLLVRRRDSWSRRRPSTTAGSRRIGFGSRSRNAQAAGWLAGSGRGEGGWRSSPAGAALASWWWLPRRVAS